MSDHDSIEGLLQANAQLTRQLEAARAIAAGLSSVTAVDDLVRQALEISLDVVNAGAGSIIMHDAENDRLVFRYVVGEKADELIGFELNCDQGVCGAVFQSGETHVSEDMKAEERHVREVGDRVQYQTLNMVTVPLKNVEGIPIGVMQVLNKVDGCFTAGDVAILDILAAQSAAAIASARLHEEARLAEVVKFIGDISHDVKNMMTPVISGAETLEFIADDVFRELDEAIASDPSAPLTRAKDITGILADFIPETVEGMKAGAEAVQERMKQISDAKKGIISKPTFEETEVREVVNAALSLLKGRAEKQKVTLAVEGDVPPAEIDRRQVYNAIYNLVFNALDACPDGRSITVRLSAQPEGRFPDGGYLQVAVADTGDGMPAHVREKLFTAKNVSTKPMGTGLGTQIVKNVVDAHGGVIWVDSEQGKGTTITFKVPLKR